MRHSTDLLLIEPGERAQVLYYLLLFLLVGTGLALGRGTTDALFLKRYGIENLPAIYVVLSAALAAVSLGYAACADRIPSERLFTILLAMLIGSVGFSWALMSFTAAEPVYAFYFVVYELASELILLHAALYLSQNLDTLQMMRLAPLIFAGTQAGMILGGVGLALLAPILGVKNVLLIWGMLGILAAYVIARHHRQAGVSPYFRPGRKGRAPLRHSIEEIAQALRFFRRCELFRAASYSLFFMVIALFVLIYSVNRVYTRAFPTEEQLGSFFGWLTAATSALALLVQLFLTNRLLHRFGVKRVNLVFPLASILSYVALLASYSLAAAIFGSLTKDVLNTSLRRPARNMFLNALPNHMQGRVRALSAALALPLALAITGGILTLAQSLEGPAYFLAAGALASALLLYFKKRVNRAYATTLVTTLKERLYLPRRRIEGLLRESGNNALAGLARGVSSPDPDLALACARFLVEMYPEQAAEIILPRLETAAPAVSDRLLRRLSAKGALVGATVDRLLDNADDHLRATVLGVLFERRHEKYRPQVASCLRSTNPRLAAVGILGVHRFGIRDLEGDARRTWDTLLAGPHADRIIAGVEMLARCPAPALRSRLPRLLRHRDDRVRKAVLKTLSQLPPRAMPGLEPELARLYRAGDPEVRELSVACFPLLPQGRTRLSLQALADRHPRVRDAALHALSTETRCVEILVEWMLGNDGSAAAQRSAIDALARQGAPRRVFERIASAKVRDARILFQARATLERQGCSADAAESLLRIVLSERLGQTIDLALMALENVEDRATIATLRAGLNSGERRHTAQAAEALRHLDNPILGAHLSALLGAARFPETESVAFNGMADVIDWCRRQPDSWLRACALRASQTMLTADGSLG